MTARAMAEKRRGRLFAVCAIAIAVRLWIAVRFPNAIHPDETFQYLEQAYRAVTGWGMVPWEYAIGARSWIIPGMLVPVIAIARLLSADPAVAIFAVAFAASAASLIIVVSAYVLGGRGAGEAAGLASAVVVALWPEVVLMSPHVLADTVVAVPLAAALAVGYRPGDRSSAAGAGSLIATGLLLCLAAELRLQLLPAIVCAGAWMAGRDPRRYALMVAGALPALAVFGLVDWLTWGKPFVSVVRYLKVNQGGVAASFGVAPFRQYIVGQYHLWRLGSLVIAATALAGVRRIPLVALVIFLILLIFSCIGHKEYRFIYPALPLLFTLCGVGTVEIARWLARRATWRLRTVAVLLVFAWAGAGAVAAMTPPFGDMLRHTHAVLTAIDAIDHDTRVCGVAVEPAMKWPDTGYVRFRDGVPLYAGAATKAEAYNAILLIGDGMPDRAIRGYRAISCIPGTPGACFLRRPGTCTPSTTGRLRADSTPAVAALLRRMALSSTKGQ